MYADDVAGLVLVDPTSDSERADAHAAVRLPELTSLPDTLDQARDSRVPVETIRHVVEEARAREF
jgi:hypothetical protein